MTTVDEAIQANLREAKHRSPLMIIVGADKGGVGKTTVARALIDYLSANGVPIRAIDTESGETGVLKRFYPRAELLNAATVPGQMAMVDGVRAEAVTLVDARAGLLTIILGAFAKIDLFGDVRAGTLQLLVLHVVGASIASSNEIPEVMAALKDARLVRVNNKINPDAKFLPAATSEVVIEIPTLEEDVAAAVDRAGVGFAAFATDRKNSRVLRGLVRDWLNKVHAAFEQAGIGGLVRQ